MKKKLDVTVHRAGRWWEMIGAFVFIGAFFLPWPAVRVPLIFIGLVVFVIGRCL